MRGIREGAIFPRLIEPDQVRGALNPASVAPHRTRFPIWQRTLVLAPVAQEFPDHDEAQLMDLGRAYVANVAA